MPLKHFYILFFFCLLALGSSAQTPVVSITGTSICSGGTLTLNSNITPYQITWSYNGAPVDSQFVSWSTSAFTVAGANGIGNGANQLNSPYGVFTDTVGNVYVVDQANNRIQKWAAGATTGATVAGGNGAGASANQLSLPNAVFVDVSGNVYVSDGNNARVQKWAPGATSGTTVAGGNGTGSNANQLSNPWGLYVDAAANVYVSDFGNNRVQKWASGATSGTTVAGGNGVGSNANQLHSPTGIYIDAGNNLYIADRNNHRIQKWAQSATSGTTLAGTGTAGTGSNALNFPTGVYADGWGNLYIADNSNNRIQRWTAGAASGVTVAGGIGYGSSVSQLNVPYALWLDPSGNIYVADLNNARIQKFPAQITNTHPAYSVGNYTAAVKVFSGNTVTTAPYTIYGFVTPAVSISASPGTTICAGANVTFTATPTYGGTFPTYQWKKNGTTVGGSGNTYTTNSIVDQDSITCILTSNFACLNLQTTALSNKLTMTVNATSSPGISVAVSPGSTICAGTPVTFTATSTNGGAAPGFQWRKNGVNVGSNSTIYSSSSLSNNDTITCVLTSNSNCVVPDSATSTPIVMTVNAVVTPSVSISASPGNVVCIGTAVTFNASGINGGAWPLFQWKKNGTNVGTNTSTYTDSSPSSGDSVTCLFTSNEPCPTQIVSTSNTIHITVNPNVTPTVSISTTSPSTICPGVNVTFTSVVTNGGTSPTYQWKKNGLNIGANTSTISINTINNNDVVSCSVSGNAMCATSVLANSNADTFTVLNAIGINSQPQSTTSCLGGNTSLTVGASGTGISYQWQLNTGSGFSNIVNNVTYSGATSSSLDITGTTANMNNYQYRCIIPGTCGLPDTSATATLTVTPPPAIQTQAFNDTICLGNNAAYSVSATGTSLSYQWKADTGSGFFDISNSSVFTGANTPSLSLLNPPLSMNGNHFKCVISGSCTPPVICNSVVLDIKIPPTLSNQPNNTTICAGSNASFSVSSSSPGISYQWQVNTGAGFNDINNNSTYSGANTNTLNISNAGAGMNSYTYRCVATGICAPPAVSTTALLTVIPLTPIAINASGPISFCPGGSVTLSTSVNVAGYQWKMNGTSIPGGSSASYLATSAGNYSLQVTDTNNCAMGSNTISVSLYPVPNASINPSGAVTICAYDSLSIHADTGSNLSYQWNMNGTAINGATDSVFTTNNAGSYTVTVHNNFGCSSTSSTVNLTINSIIPPIISNLSIHTDFCFGDSAVLQADTGYANYQWQNNGINIPGATSPTYATLNSGSYTVIGSNPPCHSSSAALNIVAYPLASDSIITNGPAVICSPNGSYMLSAVPAASQTYQWYRNGIIIIGATGMQYTATDSGSYNIRVTSAQSCTIFTRSVYVINAVSPTPIIIGGTGTTLSTGTFNSYQWYFAGTLIPGATNSSYTVPQDGSYTVMVTDSNGCSGMSAPFVITELGVSNDQGKGNAIRIYPNPASSIVYFDAPVPVNISIYDMPGKLLDTHNNVKSVDVSRLPRGMYTIRIFDEHNVLLKVEKLNLD